MLSNPLRPGLTAPEAASILGVTDRTLRNWRREGFGPAPRRLGGSVLYDPAEVEAFRAGVGR